MQSVTEIIKPIALLRGSHDDTAKTGSGCFMNVVAYLNGEPQITDSSPCVCVTVRPIVIGLNDMANDEERQRLVPFIERAMGSATDDRAELIRRAWLAVDYANACRDIGLGSAHAEAAHFHAARATAKFAHYAFDLAVAGAADCAARYADVARYVDAARTKIFEAGIAFLDAALPPAHPVDEAVLERAAALVSLAEVA